MKIDEVVTEGLFGSVGKKLGKAVGTIGKGIGKGLADIAAPGAYSNIQKKISNPARKQGGRKPKDNTVTYNGKTFIWLGQQWGLINPATGKAVPANKADQAQLNFMAGRKAMPLTAVQPKQAKTKTKQTSTREAKSPEDLVNRLFKLHPEWAPEVAKQILNRSQVAGNK